MSWDGMYASFDADGTDWFEDLNEWHMSEDMLDIVRSVRSEAHNFVDFVFVSSETGETEYEVKSATEFLSDVREQELERMGIVTVSSDMLQPEWY